MFNKNPDPKKKQTGVVILSNDPKTGKPTGNGKPLTREQERKLLEQEGGWDGGEYTTYDPQWS